MAIGEWRYGVIMVPTTTKKKRKLIPYSVCKLRRHDTPECKGDVDEVIGDRSTWQVNWPISLLVGGRRGNS